MNWLLGKIDSCIAYNKQNQDSSAPPSYNVGLQIRKKLGHEKLGSAQIHTSKD